MGLQLNHLAVGLCTLLSLVIPMIWYAFFDEQWMEMNQLSLEKVQEHSSASMYISALLSGLIGSYVLAWLWQKMNILTVKDGIVAGLAISFGLIFLTGMVENLFAHRPYALSWIDGGKSIIWMTISGAILGGWTKQS